jgi:5'-nucleotidase (lipoprotein e(P4) family)
MRTRTSAVYLTVLFFISCTAVKKTTGGQSDGKLVIDGKIWSSVFQQRAAEYKVLCLQAYNIARLRLDESLTESGKPKAIISDIDETFLDNSPYAVHRALAGKDYDPASWLEWTSKAVADTMPGALSFFNYAASKNVEIFYVTNREEEERAGTLANLQRFQFPFADNQHLILREATSSKEERRQKIAATHDIILLLGDNLADFSTLFDKKTESEREQNVYALSSEWGKKFIVLPNTNYGGWEEAIYLNVRDWTPAQKDSLLKKNLKGY